MKEYYISIKGEQSGPFSLEELKTKKLTNEYLIWNDGFESWTKASEVSDLKESVVKLPPPLPDKKFSESKAINKALVDSLIPFTLIFLITLVATGGFLSDEELQKTYSIYGNNPNYNPDYNSGASILSHVQYLSVSGSQIREFVIFGSLMLSLILSLLVLNIDYRYRIRREISKLKI